MKYILLVTILLTGCVYQSVTGHEIEKANHYCKDRGGIDEIAIEFDSHETVYCMSGESTLVDSYNPYK